MRLGFWQKLAVFASTATVGVTGLLWFVLRDILDEEPGAIAHWLLMLHGMSSYVLLVVIGSLLPQHVVSGWMLRRNIVTGIAVTAVMAVLAATGLALYYGSEDLHTPVKWVHVVIGLGCFLLFPAHAFVTARSRRSSPSAIPSRDATSHPNWRRARADQR
jgi:hypothetical protein